MITIIFSDEFYESAYSDDAAAMSGRMEAIMKEIHGYGKYPIHEPFPASLRAIGAVHEDSYIEKVRADEKLCRMALLSAGAAIASAELGFEGHPAMAINRPPGHHAHPDRGWGYCHFNNVAIALTQLRQSDRIKSAFVLDFDAHTGDGTIDCLSDWNECKILNPMGHDRAEYLKITERYIAEMPPVDIVAVCAGFDSYEKDLGRKLASFDFYLLGRVTRQLSESMCSGRRFAVLEGGYYLPHLGKNVLSFCQGFESNE